MATLSVPMVRPTSNALEGDRLGVVLVTIGINIAALLISVTASWATWQTAFMLGLLNNAVLVLYAVCARDKLFGHLILFGAVAGLAELVADAWLVKITGTLAYPSGNPMIWCSPVWMPLAWQSLAVQLGYIGIKLFKRWGAIGLVLAGAFGALNIPLYEEIAVGGDWWRYSNCRMLCNTPYYIILGEFVIVLLVGFFARHAQRSRVSSTVVAGAAAGLSALPAYGLAFLLLDRLF